MTQTRVLIVDDQQLVRDGIASLLALNEAIDVVGTAANGKECLALIEDRIPDVILMDLRMPVMDGIETTAAIRAAYPEVHVLVLTTFDDDEYIMKSLRAGAEGYLLKDLPIDDLARAIAQTANGTTQLAAGTLEAILRTHDGNRTRTPDPDLQEVWNELNRRERDVLRLIGRGATNGEIAAELHLSEGTVRNYVSTILAAFDFRDRVEAALTAVRCGWD